MPRYFKHKTIIWRAGFDAYVIALRDGAAYIKNRHAEFQSSPVFTPEFIERLVSEGTWIEIVEEQALGVINEKEGERA